MTDLSKKTSENFYEFTDSGPAWFVLRHVKVVRIRALRIRKLRPVVVSVHEKNRQVAQSLKPLRRAVIFSHQNKLK